MASATVGQLVLAELKPAFASNPPPRARDALWLLARRLFAHHARLPLVSPAQPLERLCPGARCYAAARFGDDHGLAVDLLGLVQGHLLRLSAWVSGSSGAESGADASAHCDLDIGADGDALLTDGAAAAAFLSGPCAVLWEARVAVTLARRLRADDRTAAPGLAYVPEAVALLILAFAGPHAALAFGATHRAAVPTARDERLWTGFGAARRTLDRVSAEEWASLEATARVPADGSRGSGGGGGSGADPGGAALATFRHYARRPKCCVQWRPYRPCIRCELLRRPIVEHHRPLAHEHDLPRVLAPHYYFGPEPPGAPGARDLTEALWRDPWYR